MDIFTSIIILSQLLAIFSVLLSSYGIVIEALEDIKNKKISANILMVTAAVASFFIFHGQEGATAILLYAIAEYLEELTTDKSKNAIKELLELAPDEALLKSGNSYMTVPTSEVKVGDLIGVKPGMKIPLDGRIVKGEVYINESAITGESIPVFKQAGDEVFAATIVTDNFIEIEITKDSSNTVVAQIARSIQNALANKSQKEKFIERFAKYYTPTILISALLVMILPFLLFGQDFNTWFYRGLVLLVVSCPCALTLSTPLANISALTKLAREGILVKGNRFIEMVDDVDVFAFDKTGTLTEGNLRVFDIIAYDLYKSEVLSIASSLEAFSEHPIAKAIITEANLMNIPFKPVEKFQVIQGQGIGGQIEGETYYVGNPKFIIAQNITIPNNDLKVINDVGTIPILVANTSKVLGIISIRDVLRITAPILIDGLKKRGFNTVLISGDKKAVCSTIGDCLDVDETYGELLPEQKLEQIKSLKKKFKGVAMVGDGINDAPALSLSNLGIAIGASATDLTLETADIIIMNDDLKKVLTYIDISKKTNTIIKQNIWTSILIKVTFAILTVFGLMTLWFAVGIGDMGVSLLVFANGLRVFYNKHKYDEIASTAIETTAKLLVCEHCETKNIIPQHHGRDMVVSGDNLVCWREMIGNKQIKSCDAQVPLDCPICNNKYEII